MCQFGMRKYAVTGRPWKSGEGTDAGGGVKKTTTPPYVRRAHIHRTRLSYNWADAALRWPVPSARFLRAPKLRRTGRGAFFSRRVGRKPAARARPPAVGVERGGRTARAPTPQPPPPPRRRRSTVNQNAPRATVAATAAATTAAR